MNSWGVWEGGREREIELRERKQNTERKNCLFFSFQNFGEREFGGQNGEEKKTPRKEQPQTFFSSLFNPPSVPWFFFTMNELERERAYGEKRERETVITKEKKAKEKIQRKKTRGSKNQNLMIIFLSLSLYTSTSTKTRRPHSLRSSLSLSTHCAQNKTKHTTKVKQDEENALLSLAVALALIV